MKVEGISAHARQYHRHSTKFEARVEPHPDHAEQFRLSFPDALSGIAVIDVSEGGLGLSTETYFPKNLRLTLYISHRDAEEGLSSGELVLRGIVRRCVMLDHKPTYQIGIQFVDTQGVDERRLIEAALTVPADARESAASVSEPATAAAAVRVSGGSGGS